MSKSVPIDLLRDAELKTDDDLINDILNETDDSDNESIDYIQDNLLDSMINNESGPELPGPELPAPELPGPELPAPELPVPELPAPELPINIEKSTMTNSVLNLYTKITENIKPAIIVFILILFIYFEMYKNVIITIQNNINIFNNKLSSIIINAFISSIVFIILNIYL